MDADIVAFQEVEGKVAVLRRNGEDYQRIHYIKSTGPVMRERYFGTGLAADDGRVAIGAQGEDAAYVLW